MKRQKHLKHRLDTLAALHEAVGAMRSVSAHHFRVARAGLATARDYRRDVQCIVSEVGIRQPLGAIDPTGLLVVASDLGLCGDYNSRLGQLALAQSKLHPAVVIYSVGRRVRGTLSRSQRSVARAYDAATSLDGLARLLVRLAQDLLGDYEVGKIGSLDVISASFEGIGRFSAVSTRVLPITPVAASHPIRPSTYLAQDQVVRAVVQEFLYITLYELLLDAMAAEHGMRLMSAESALRWLEEISDQTARRLTNARNEDSTQELLDIVSGRVKRNSRRPADGSTD